jgi:hypothetical protein
MTTPSRRIFVSIATAISVTLGLGACVRQPSHQPPTVLPVREAAPVAIRFDNYATEHVHVYLIGAKRQWLLGRVDPGAVAILLVPGESLTEGSTFVRLGVLTGRRVTLEAARNGHATLTVAQPASVIVSQRWRFAQGQLISLAR